MSCDNCSREKPVTLLTGKQCCTYCDQHRFECEARAVLLMPSKDARNEYIASVEKRRGKQSADELRGMVLDVWERGKRG